MFKCSAILPLAKLQVEVPGLEPGSMIPDQGVSTCLVYLLIFSLQTPIDGSTGGSNLLSTARS